MTAYHNNFYLEKGTSFYKSISLNNINSLNGILNIQMIIKEALYLNNIIKEYNINNGIMIDNQNNEIIIQISAGDSFDFEHENYVYEINIIDNQGIVTRILEGILYIKPGLRNE